MSELHAVLIARLIPLLTVPGLSGAAAAAEQALAACQAEDAGQLLAAARGIAFALAAIDSLSLSADPALPLPLKLRFRGNAAALNRCAQPAARTPEPHRPPPKPPDPAAEQERKSAWAAAMTKLAAECTRNLDKIPPAYRPTEAARIAALTETAHHLTGKAALLSSTTLGR